MEVLQTELLDFRIVTLVIINAILTQPEREIANYNISHANVHLIKNIDGTTKVSDSLGSTSLLDLTVHGKYWRDRYLSSDKKALNFKYCDFGEMSEKLKDDAELKLEMLAVHYVHTRRFLYDLQNFFIHFSQLSTVMANLRAGKSAAAIINENKRSLRLSLDIHAGAPVILLPVSSRSKEMILLNLGELSAHNTFIYSENHIECLLDVINIDLVNMDLYAAKNIDINEKNFSSNYNLLNNR